MPRGVSLTSTPIGAAQTGQTSTLSSSSTTIGGGDPNPQQLRVRRPGSLGRTNTLVQRRAAERAVYVSARPRDSATWEPTAAASHAEVVEQGASADLMPGSAAGSHVPSTHALGLRPRSARPILSRGANDAFDGHWNARQREREVVTGGTRTTVTARAKPAQRPMSAPSAARNSKFTTPGASPRTQHAGVAGALGQEHMLRGDRRPSSAIPAHSKEHIRRDRPLSAAVKSSRPKKELVRQDTEVHAEAQVGLHKLRAKCGATFSTERVSELRRVFGCGHGAVSLSEFRRGLQRLGILLSEPASERLFESADRTRSGYVQPFELGALIADSTVDVAKGGRRASSAARRLRTGVAGASPLSPRPPIPIPPYGIDTHAPGAWVGLTGARRMLLRSRDEHRAEPPLTVNGTNAKVIVQAAGSLRAPDDGGAAAVLPGPKHRSRHAEVSKPVAKKARPVHSQVFIRTGSAPPPPPPPEEQPVPAEGLFLGKPLSAAAEMDERVTSVALAVADKVRERSRHGARGALSELTGGSWSGSGSVGVAVTARDVQRTIVTRLHLPCGLPDAELVVKNLAARASQGAASTTSPEKGEATASERPPAAVVDVASQGMQGAGLTWSDLTHTWS